MNIKERYRPYNFSSTRCHVIVLDFSNAGFFGIEEKLPLDIEILKGIYITAKCNIPFQTIGGISLNFNEGAIKAFQMVIPNTKALRDTSHPVPVNEEIFSNSIMQGFYVIPGNGSFIPAGYIKIYLHYKPRQYDIKK